MNFKNKQILIRYTPYPNQVIMAYLIEKVKKNFQIVNQTKYVLEPYQLEEGLIIDYQVISDKLNQGLGKIEKGVKDGIVVVYDTPDLLRFNTILPKSNLGKAKKLAKKELSDFFQADFDNYHTVYRIVSCRERGIIFYYDLISEATLKSLESVANAMDCYIDSHTNYVQGIAAYFEAEEEDETDAFLIYQDDLATHIMLLYRSKLIDSVSFYESVEIEKIVSGIELLRNKHLFAFERKETNNVVLILNGETGKRVEYSEELKEHYGFDVLERELKIEDILIHILKNSADLEEGFYIKI